MEKYGIDQLCLISDAVAEGVNVTEKILNGGGVLSAFALSDELSALHDLKKEQVKSEFLELSAEERAQVTARFKGKLVLKNKMLEAQLEGNLDLIFMDAVECVFDGVALYHKVESLVTKFKALNLSPAPVVPVAA